MALLIIPFSVWPQVIIKERVNIRPKPPSVRNLPSSAPDLPIFTEGQRVVNRSQGTAVYVTRPAVVTGTGTIHVDPGPDGEYPNTDLSLYYGGSVIVSYRKYPDSGPETYNASVTRPIRCGYTGPELWSALSALELEDVAVTVGGSSASITFTGKLGGLYPYTATANLSASPDGSYDLSTIVVAANPGTITRCSNTTAVAIQLRDGSGRVFPSGNCGSTSEVMTVSYTYTSTTPPSVTFDGSAIEGMGTTIEARDRSGELTWDPASADDEGEVTIRVDASGKSGSTAIHLSRQASPPVLSLDCSESYIVFGMKSRLDVTARDCKGEDTPLPSGVKYQFSILSGPGYLQDPVTGSLGRSLTSVSHIQGKASVVYSSHDTLYSPSARIEVRASDQSIQPVHVAIDIIPVDLVISLSKTPVFYGDSTRLTAQVRNPDGSVSPIPTDWSTSYEIIDNDTLAFFSTPDGRESGTYLSGNYPWVGINTRPKTSPPDSVELVIGVSSY
ncbi:MAG TPA: hypothetical protein VMM37_09875, partial [Bacteroidota bacterium]|nr:hypothetical protein [Bacteroidota bacterium]